MRINEVKVVVRGGGDLASGVTYRLKRSGFQVIVTEVAQPLVVRRTVSFGETIYARKIELEGLCGIYADNLQTAVLQAGQSELVPVVVDPEGEIIKYWQPMVIVDAIMAKRNLAKTTISDAEFVIGLGPGFTVGIDVHAVIETKRGHSLGRVLYAGQAAPNSGIPGIVQGIGRERVIYSNRTGIFSSKRQIGDWITAGEIFGYVAEEPVYAEISGCIRGLLKPGIWVKDGVKIGDIDPRKDASFTTISDKALAVGGGVLEAIMTAIHSNIELIGI